MHMSVTTLLKVVKAELRTFFCVGILLISTLLSGCSGMGPGNPNSSMVADREIINVGESVNFDARTSSTPEPTIIDEFRWNFGDGNTKITKQGIVNHIYNQAGTFEVEVIVVNDEGATDSTTLSIFVNSAPQIEIDFPDFIKTGESALLDATDSFDPEGAPMEYFWDFDLNVDDDSDDVANTVDTIPPLDKATVELRMKLLEFEKWRSLLTLAVLVAEDLPMLYLNINMLLETVKETGVTETVYYVECHCW